MGDKSSTPTAIRRISRWVRSRSVREMLIMAAAAAFLLLVLLKVFVKNHTHFFVAAQVAHFSGILVLIYKLTFNKSCAGVSLKTQELTAIFLSMRLLCSVIRRGDIHVVLDSLTFVSTFWVICMMRFQLKTTYLRELDTMPLYYVLGSCAIVALIGHPGWKFDAVFRFFWVYILTIEAVSVLPQLRLIQNAKMVEPFTAHYVFALGVARFLLCANWIIMVIDSKGAILTHIGNGNLWIIVSLLCEMVQTFILADFCYYYVKSVMEGQRLMRLPSLV